jgi:hypothetical protein
MSKKSTEHLKNTQKIEAAVMAKISSGAVTMKPRWYFVAGSVLMTLGLMSAGIATLFLTNLSFFLLRQHGPRGEWRLQRMLESFPWWVPALAVLGTGLGVYLLKKYDFSYKKNFTVIVAICITAIIAAAFVMDLTGINDTWFRKGPMRRLYQQNTINKDTENPQGNYGMQGKRMNQNPGWRQP